METTKIFRKRILLEVSLIYYIGERTFNSKQTRNRVDFFENRRQFHVQKTLKMTLEKLENQVSEIIDVFNPFFFKL